MVQIITHHSQQRLSYHTAKMGDTGFDPQRSKVTPDKLAEFIMAPITGDLEEVETNIYYDVMNKWELRNNLSTKSLYSSIAS